MVPGGAGFVPGLSTIEDEGEMSFKVINAVLESNLKRTHKLVMIALASYAKNDGTEARPAMSGLAKRAGISRTTAYAYLEVLGKAGIISKADDKHFYGRGHWSHVWEINLTALSKHCTVSNPRTVSKVRKSSVQSTDSALSNPRMQIRPIEQSVRKEKSVQEQRSEKESEGVVAADAAPTATLRSEEETTEEFEKAVTEVADWYRKFNFVPDETLLLKAASDLVEILAQRLCQPRVALREVQALWDWNQRHKRGKLRFRGLSKLVAALRSNSEDGLLAQYEECNNHPCKLCETMLPG